MKKDYPLPGEKWRHYKGGVYEVITLAKNTETDEIMVVYQSISFGTIYTRPLNIWDETVENKRGGIEQRFNRL